MTEPMRPPHGGHNKEEIRLAHAARALGISVEAARQRLDIQARTRRIAGPLRSLLGDRLGEVRFDPEGYVQLTIIDMTPEDVAAVDQMAAAAGLPDSDVCTELIPLTWRHGKTSGTS
jgi:hypothetical protein